MEYDARNRFSLWAIIILVILNAGTIGLLWHGRLDRRPGPLPPANPNPDAFMIREIGLEGDQVELFRQYREEYFEEVDSIRAEMHQFYLLLAEELFANSPDTAKARQLEREIGQRQAALEASVFRHFEKIKDICNPQQRENFREVVMRALRSRDAMRDGPDGEHRRPPEMPGAGQRWDDRPPPRPDGQGPPPNGQPPGPPGGGS